MNSLALFFKPALAVVVTSLFLSSCKKATENAEPLPSPVAAARNPWMTNHERLVQLAKKGNIDVYFLGDSITEGWTRPNRGEAFWNEHFKSLKSENFGIGGDRTENVLWRLENGEFAGVNPKVVVLMIGTNNFSRDTAPQIVEGVTAIVHKIREMSPQTKILLLAIFPKGQTPQDRGRPKLAEINPELAKLNDGKHVFFLDIGPKFLQPDGTILPEIMPDFLHLTPAGYKIWGDAIISPLQELLKAEKPNS